MARKFIQMGAQVISWDYNKSEAVHKELASIAGEESIVSYAIDVSDKDQVYELAARVKKEVGKVDIVINNAGVVSGGNSWEVKDESIEKVMKVNTMGPMWITKAFIKDFVDADSGHLVYISSMASTLGTNKLADYCASKWGIFGYAESIRLELGALGKKNVHTTIVCPYYINTGMFDGVTSIGLMMKILQPEPVVDSIVEAILTNRHELYLPAWMPYLTFLMRAFLPSYIRDMSNDILGVSKSMDQFKGQRRV